MNDDDLREEIEYHLERRAALDNSTRAAARRQFGNPTQIQEELRAMRIPIWLDGMRQDLAYAVRTFTRTPGFTAASIIALALGIGSVTAVFSVVDPLLFRPLPYAHEDRLVSIGMAAPIEPDEWLLGPDYIEWRDKQTAFTSMTASYGRRTCDLAEGDPARLHCEAVESTYLPTFGIRPALGRNFTFEEDQPGAAPVALISNALWRTRFGAASHIVGQQVNLEGRNTQIIGVLPADYESPALQRIDFLVPMRMDVQQEGGRISMGFYRVYGRLKPGFTVDQARDSLKSLFDHAMKFVPPHFRNEVKLRVSNFRDRQVKEYRTASLVLLGAVLCVLLVACANVANLMLARSATRQREMAVRAAIGASRLRLVRQTLTEDLLLSATAGVAGIALAYGLLTTFRNLAPEGIPRLTTATLDWRVLAFAILVALMSGTLAGLAPALRIPTTETLTGSRTTGPRRDWLRQTLVAAQIAISLVLLVGSGLLIRSLWRIQQINLGVRTSQILVTRIDLDRDRSAQSQRAFFLDLEQRLKQIPGVEVALSDSLPPQERMMAMIFSRIEKEGILEDTRSGTGGMVSMRMVSPNYFQTLALPIVRGRPFTEADRESAESLVIVDETLARRLYPGEDAVGKRIRPGTMADGGWMTICGVARNALNAGLFHASDPEYYVLLRNHADWGRRGLFLSLRSPRDPRAVAPLIRAEINRLDPKLPVEIEALDTRVRQLSARPRFNAMLLALFATIALALAAIGLPGVVGYLVTQRTQELGVRMALGASPANIRSLVLNQSLRWIISGAAVGFAVGLDAARALKSLLYQVEPNDPLILGSVTALLIAVGVLSAWLPARRASRLDPMTALRHD